MKSFLKIVLGTMVGILLLFFLISFVGIFSISKLSQKSKVSINPNTVLRVDFSTPIGERGIESPFSELDIPFNPGPDAKLGLDQILLALNKAKDDSNVKGIYLDLNGIAAGWVQMEDIRNGLIDFKESGKFIYAYGEMISQKAYYMASIADKIYLNPSGILELKGFGAEVAFLKNALEKLDIEPRIFYAGKFKSATEPLRLEKMSDENRQQIKAYLNGFYQNYLDKVSVARNMSKDQLHNIIDNLLIRDPEDALGYSVVDELLYEDAVYDKIRESSGLDMDDKIKFASLSKYIKTGVDDTKFSKNKIAIVYADGDIVDGKGDGQNIASARYTPIFEKIRLDDNVKAVVLRVNSPGGSALASDVIWNEINRIKEKGIPVVTSMSDYAASGGYFIACNSDKIFAESTTLTGSIGVFGILMDMDQFFNEKLGITFDTVKTTKYSDFPNSALLTGDLTSTEEEIITNSIKKIYKQFKERVAKGRGLTMEQVEEVAQGRVWTGQQALTNGLVDEIGNMEDALAEAAEMAGLDEYRKVSYPKAVDPVQQIMNKLSGNSDEEVAKAILKSRLGRMYKHLEFVDKITQWNTVQARMPFSVEIY